MADVSNTPYDDILTDEEDRILAGMDGAAPADAASPPAPEARPADPTSPAAPDPASSQTAPATPAAPAAQTDDERFVAWQAQHAGKTPDELARLAFQQTQRAERAGFQARQSAQTVEQINARVREAADRAAARRADVADRRKQFDERLATDPDAATRDVNNRLLTAEEEEIEREAQAARIDAAIGMASQAIPDFQAQAPQIFGFGAEMGYTKEELDGIADHRDIVTLYLAGLAGKMIKAGVIDTRGQMIAMPSAIAATDPRLSAPAPVATLSSAAARPAGGTKTVEQRGTDILNLSAEDFDKIPPAELENLLAQLQS